MFSSHRKGKKENASLLLLLLFQIEHDSTFK